jgi:zinc transport system ATP-binding protein
MPVAPDRRSQAVPAAPAGAPPLVELAGVGVRLGGRTVLDHVDLTVAPGEIVTLIGPNGAGKTTTARAVMGLVGTSAGTVTRRRGLVIGYVPQRLTIDPILPLTVLRLLRLIGRVERGAAEAALDEVGARGLIDRSVHELSGGERQRVLLARALLRDPDLLVLDEPTQNLDYVGQTELYALIRRIRDRRGCGVLLISHDLHVVMSATDRVVCINRHVCCSGQPEDVGRHPEYVALFGPREARQLAVYTHHHHDHRHDAAGNVVPLDPAETPGRDADQHGAG